MRYLVTGGAGFIGSHLVDSLIGDGCEVVVVDNLATGRLANINKKANYIGGSVIDPSPEFLYKAARGCAGIFHLAAIHGPSAEKDWTTTEHVNVAGSLNVFDAARRRAIPVVIASSAAVYGKGNGHELAEVCPPDPVSIYGASKASVELIAGALTRAYRVPTLSLRLFNVYGPRQQRPAVVASFYRDLRFNEPLSIYGSGHQVRDFVYVGDVVRAFRLGMDKLRDPRGALGGALNICTGHGSSIHDLVGAFLEVPETLRLDGRYIEKNVHPIARPLNDIDFSVGDPSLAHMSLGFESSVTLRDGLVALIKEEGVERE